jgi:hypothetical protein
MKSSTRFILKNWNDIFKHKKDSLILKENLNKYKALLNPNLN